MWYHKPEAPANGGQSHSVHAWTFGAFFLRLAFFVGPVPMSEWSMGFSLNAFLFLFVVYSKGMLKEYWNHWQMNS
jgi:hypothetical protein|tara:strand:+ start:750 stop:974 length:225 start_codon:yes stop_codon:yes gene_type:complete